MACGHPVLRRSASHSRGRLPPNDRADSRYGNCDNSRQMCRRLLKQFMQLSILLCALAQNAAAAVQLEVVSKPYTNASISFGDSLGVQLSGDGKWALITSSADAIPRENSVEPSLDVFPRNIATTDPKLISRTRK